MYFYISKVFCKYQTQHDIGGFCCLSRQAHASITIRGILRNLMTLKPIML